MPASLTQQTAEKIARESYGKLLAWLAYQWRDLASAEDALSEALRKALQLWPSQGIPDKPQSWLLQVAHRELLQGARQKRLHESPQVQALIEFDEADQSSEGTITDDRLQLLFVCAHPAIDPAMRTPLMLQTVLGIESKHLANCLLLSPSAMAQRLVRVKQKIRVTGLRFEIPLQEDMPERLHAVLEAIYAAYGLAWEDAQGASPVQDLRQEALYLGQLICQLLPSSAEAKGLLALMLFCEARQTARIDPSTQALIALHRQDTGQWNQEFLSEAEQLLAQAAALQDLGAFQLEAAIQSAHVQRRHTGQVPWRAIANLYEALIECSPTLGAQVAYTVALMNDSSAGALNRAQERLALIAKAYPAAYPSYAPYWAASAHLAEKLGQSNAACAALQKAYGLSHSKSNRLFLMQEIKRLSVLSG